MLLIIGFGVYFILFWTLSEILEREKSNKNAQERKNNEQNASDFANSIKEQLKK